MKQFDIKQQDINLILNGKTDLPSVITDHYAIRNG